MATDKTERLKAVIEAYGADPARWPKADRVALADVARPEGAISEAKEVDRVLAAAGRPAVPPGARARLQDAIEGLPQEAVPAVQSAVSPFGVSRFAAVSTLAASLFIGVYIGALGNVDPVLFGESDGVIWSDSDGLEDPFDLDSLIGADNGGSG